MNKEKVFAWIESLEDMADQSDRYFVERTELYKENQEKDKEIERLNNIIDKIFEWMKNKYDNSDLTGFTVSFQELEDLKELKEGK